MTPSQQAKTLGCESLAQVARVSGVNPRTLLNYHKHKPWLFEAVCEKVGRERKPGQNIDAAKMIVDAVTESQKIQMSFDGFIFTAQVDGYEICNDEWGKRLEIHGFTIHCNKESNDE